MKYDYLIVGAGFAGCVLAERLASQCDKKILLIDRRPHIGGNAYDLTNGDGIRVHQYGPHLFHTNSEKVFAYLSNFTAWHPYEHRVLSSVHGALVPMPINRTTVNQVLGYSFSTDGEVEAFFAKEKEHVAEILNSEDLVVSKVGRRLFDLLYRGYTKKQWGREPRQLSASVCGRLAVRTGTDDRYFDDRFQAVPLHGYTAMFDRMVSHMNIHVELSTAFNDLPRDTFNELIFTGPIDEYFSLLYGPLPYRSIRFAFETHEVEFTQPVAQVNYPNDHAFTRITEFKHITGQQHRCTTIAKEFPQEGGDPYYPVPEPAAMEVYRKYRAESHKLTTVHFIGRLANYQYYNMDQVVGRCLMEFETVLNRTSS